MYLRNESLPISPVVLKDTRVMGKAMLFLNECEAMTMPLSDDDCMGHRAALSLSLEYSKE